MRRLQQFGNSLRALFNLRQSEQDLDDELQDHLAAETESNIRAGMTPEEARFAAQRAVGSLSLYKEECRDARGVGFLETSARDLRYGLRMLRRTPLFTAVAVMTLAIGIGANTTVFTFVENVLLRSLPAQDPERLAVVNWGIPNLSFPNYLDFRDRNKVFSDLAAYRYGPANMSAAGHANYRGYGYEATGNYFRMLGVTPYMGRLFGPQEDDQPGAHPVVVIGYKAWQGRFQADPAIIGKTLKINGYPFSIIGVAGPAFAGTELIVEGEYWVPMCMSTEIEMGDDWTHRRASQDAWVMGRLKPDVTITRAEENLNQIAGEIAHEHPSEVSGKERITLSRAGLIGDGLRRPVTGFGLVLMSVAALGLLLACVNLAGMLLARASDRRREIGIRLAIGASRGQLLRQLMTESFLLAGCGGFLGYAFALLACRFLSGWRPVMVMPINVALVPNLDVLWFTIAVVVLATVLCGLAPALQTVRVDLVPSLKNEPVSTRFQRWSLRDILVTGQIALSVVLVICSVLVVRSLQNALTLNLGFQPENAVSISFDLGLKGYDGEHIRRLQTTLLQQVSALPGIESAGITNSLPLSTDGTDSEYLWPDGQPLPQPADRITAMLYNISDGYLKTAGTRLLAGRAFDPRDRHDGHPVAIINETSARLLFGNANPLGKRVHVSSVGGTPEIVGLVEDGKYLSLGEDRRPAVFVPISQQENRWTTLVVRTALPPGNAIAQLRSSVKSLDPEITVFNAGSLTAHLALPLLGARMAAIVLGSLGFFAMTLAAIGLFALMSYAVSRRTREIGIRMALGASRKEVLSSLFTRTLTLCAIGISLGAFITMAAGRLLSAVLYGVSPRDPVTYCVVLLLMITVALVACWLPASRAIRIEPTVALRCD
jgi:predicted permease